MLPGVGQKSVHRTPAFLRIRRGNRPVGRSSRMTPYPYPAFKDKFFYYSVPCPALEPDFFALLFEGGNEGFTVKTEEGGIV